MLRITTLKLSLKLRSFSRQTVHIILSYQHIKADFITFVDSSKVKFCYMNIKL